MLRLKRHAPCLMTTKWQHLPVQYSSLLFALREVTTGQQDGPSQGQKDAETETDITMIVTIRGHQVQEIGVYLRPSLLRIDLISVIHIVWQIHRIFISFSILITIKSWCKGHPFYTMLLVRSAQR